MTSFADIGKKEALKRLFEGSPFKQVESVAHRVFLEGVDFNLVYFPLKHLGYKAVTAVSGELFSQLRHPESLSVVLGVSSKLDYPQIQELWSGISVAAKEYGYKDVALDLRPSKNGLCISVSANGSRSKLAEVSRPKPASKDLLCVTGRLGAAYLGMQVMERELARFDKGESDRKELEQYKMQVAAYLKPELDPTIVDKFEEDAIIPSAGILITDGLSDAVKRIAEQTGLGAKVYAERIPFEGNSFELGRKLGLDPVSAAMNGGEDFQILYVVPILQMEKFRRDFQTFDIIGHLALPEVGTVLVTPEGVELPLRSQGWNEQEDQQKPND
ncbi:MAG: thiamine-phosphate kinase [Bacteroidales bacterium]|nr:thiamine-phosphate kinase [Bacteroidales bacterium]